MTTSNDQTHPAVELLATLPTASISDALDKLSLPGSLLGIKPVHSGQRMCGPAFTVSYAPIGEESGGTVGDFLDDVPAGAVVMIDNDGRPDCTVWGGILTQIASSAGIAGTVINGACRDLAAGESTGYPLFSAATFMRTGKDRVRMVAVQRPVVVDSVTIQPGDLVCGDEDGVVVVPAGRARQVAELARDIDTVEDRIVEAVRAGSTLVQARKDFGYHTLQTASGS